VKNADSRPQTSTKLNVVRCGPGAPQHAQRVAQVIQHRPYHGGLRIAQCGLIDD